VQLVPANEGAMDKFINPIVIKRTTNFFKGEPFLNVGIASKIYTNVPFWRHSSLIVLRNCYVRVTSRHSEDRVELEKLLG
jgi:hypothetical protein